MRRMVSFAGLAAFALLATVGCSKGGSAAATDGAADGAGEAPIPVCPAVDAGAGDDAAADAAPTTDEFGPHAPAAKTASSLGRVNIYEITAPVFLQRIDIFLRATLDNTRATIAVHEAATRTDAFVKLMDIQIDVGLCEGWASTGPLAIPLKVGRFYAIGFDPNQALIPFVSADATTLPIDGAFGRLVSSKTATSVSVPSITWDKATDKEFNRQRLVTSPRAADPPSASDAGGDAAASDAARDGVDASRG